MKRQDLPDVDEIIMLRNALGITQPQLAKLTGISRGTIGRIESKKYIPKIDVFQKIYRTLYAMRKDIRKPVYNICSKKITYLTPKDTLEKVKNLFLETGFDAIPIIENKRILRGKITNLGVISLKRGKRKDSKILLDEILEEAPPTIPHKTPAYWVDKFLSNRGDCIILTKNGIFVGIATPWDLITRK